MTRADILSKASEIVTKDRQDQYGNAENNFALIAQLWSALLGIEITPHDVGLMMIQLKVARAKTGVSKDDSYIDICGYGALAGEIATNAQ